jgi:hypothetical protein
VTEVAGAAMAVIPLDVAAGAAGVCACTVATLATPSVKTAKKQLKHCNFEYTCSSFVF